MESQTPSLCLASFTCVIFLRFIPIVPRSVASFFLFFFFLKIFIYLFIWLRRVLVAACGLLSSGVWALKHMHWGSVVVACGLSCPAACGILVPRPGIEPASPALEGGFLTTGPPGKSPELLFFLFPNLWYQMNIPRLVIICLLMGIWDAFSVSEL